MVKATLVLEDDNGLQQHPAPDTEAGTASWHTTARTTPLHWTGELKRALLIVESGYAHTHDITIDRAWLSR